MKRFVVIAEYKVVYERDAHLKMTKKTVPFRWYVGDTQSKKLGPISPDTWMHITEDADEADGVARELNRLHEVAVRERVARN